MTRINRKWNQHFVALSQRTSVRGLALLTLCYLSLAAPARAGDDDDELTAALRSAAPVDPRAMEVRFNDDSRLKFTLTEDHIEMTSRYGTLQVAASDIRKIDFALRLSTEKQKEIHDAIVDLESSDAGVRKSALARLKALGTIAYPALMKAATGETFGEKRAADLLEKLKEGADEQDFAPRDQDVVQTVDSTITGQIVTPALKVRTAQFGELSLKLADARSLRWQGLAETKPEPDDKNALPDPGNLFNYPDRSGKPLKFRVTGRTDGFVWGTDIYTADSMLATAAVHAGAVKTGQTAAVKVQLVAPPPAFAGTTRNGVSSQDYGPFPEAFRFVK